MNRLLGLSLVLGLLALAPPAHAADPLEEAAAHPLWLRGAWKSGEAKGRFVVYGSLKGEALTGRLVAPRLPFRGTFDQRAVTGTLTAGALRLTVATEPPIVLSGALAGDVAKGTRLVGGKPGGAFALAGFRQVAGQARVRLWLTNRLVWFAYLSGASKRVPALIKALEASGVPVCFDTAAKALAASGQPQRARALASKAGPKTLAAVERLLAGEGPAAVEGAPKGAELLALRDRVWKSYLASQPLEGKDAAQAALLATNPATRDAFLAVWALRRPCPLPNLRVRLLQVVGMPPSSVEAWLKKQATKPQPKPLTRTTKAQPLREAQPLAAGAPELPRRDFTSEAVSFKHLFLTSERPVGWLTAPWAKDYPRHLLGFDVYRYLSLPDGAALARLPATKPGALPPRPRAWSPGITRFPAPTPATHAAVQALTKALASRFAHERSSAVTKLGKLGPAARVPLIRSLGDKQDYVRREAAQALGRMGPAALEAAPALVRLLGAKGRREAQVVAQALGALGPRALPSLRAALASGPARRRAHAATAIGCMGAGAAPALPLLLQALESEAVELRAAAAEALGRVGPSARTALPRLEAALSDAQPAVQARALGAIRAIDPATLAKRVDALRALLASKDAVVRLEALQTTGCLGAQALPVVPAMVSALHKTATRQASQAQAALAWVGPGVVEPITKALAAETNAYRRKTLVRVLGLLGSRGAKAVPTLLARLEDANQGVRRAAVDALKATGRLAAPALLGAIRARRPGGVLAHQALRGLGVPVQAVAHPVLAELHAQSVANRQRALTNWLIARFRHAVAEPYLRKLPFAYETLRYGELRLASGDRLGGLTVRLKFQNVDRSSFLDRRAFLQGVSVKEEGQELVVRCGLKATNVKGRKLYVRVQLGRGDRVTPLQHTMVVKAPYDVSEWKTLKLVIPLAKVRAAFGAKDPALIALVTCYDAPTGELLAQRRVAFGLATRARYTLHDLRKIRIESSAVPGQESLKIRLAAWANSMQGKRLEFRATLFEADGRVVPGGQRSAHKIGGRGSTQGIEIAFPPAFLREHLKGRRRPYYVGLAMLAGSPAQILEFDIVPFVYGPVPPVTAILSGFLIEGSGCHALLGTGIGGKRSFWKLPAKTRGAVLKNHASLVTELLALASRARVALPPARPELAALLLAKQRWSYRSGWSHLTAESNTSSLRKVNWSFHPDQTCEFTSNWNFFTNSTTHNTPSSAGALYRPGLPSGTIVATAHANLGEKKQGARSFFDVRGEPGGPFWIVRYDASGTTTVHPFAPKKRGQFGISKFEAMAIDDTIEGDYKSGDGYKFRTGPGTTRD